MPTAADERMVQAKMLGPLPFEQWLAAIGIPAKSDALYEAALSAASGVKVPRKPAPPLGGENANRAARRRWEAEIRTWERVRRKALDALRVKHARSSSAQEGGA